MALILSGFAQLLSVFDATAFAGVRPSQKQTASRAKDTRQNNKAGQDKSVARTPKEEPRTDFADYSSPEGPIIRVALMTDVTAVNLSSPSGLIVNRMNASVRDGKKISSGSLRVELSQGDRKPEPAPVPEPDVDTFRVIVGFAHEAGVAHKLAEDLKKKFFEPVTTSFDKNHNEYTVSIGQCPTRNEAAQLSERLRKAGYDGLRIVSDSKTGQVVVAKPVSSSRVARDREQSAASTSERYVEAGRPVRLIAMANDKIAATSEEELIVSPVGVSATNRIKQSALSYEDDEKGNRAKHAGRPEPTANQAPPAVRVGTKEYRGEIHLVLNSRGLINIVNVLPVEDYLRGVVLMEIPMGSVREIEALKAQAVAARSYALNHISAGHTQGYDLVDDARAQSYGGLASERELTNRAVDETRGVVALSPNANGKLIPIEALYTANCGGRTENNEEVFGGKARPYLRSVACVLDRQPLAGRDIVTSRAPEPLSGTNGRAINREVARLSVLGFSLPRRVTGHYLQNEPDRDEIKGWVEQLALIIRREKAGIGRGDITKFSDFARSVAAVTYGEGRAGSALDPADVDYLLSGVRIEQLSRDARGDVALLLRDGILHLGTGVPVDGRSTITRAQAIETIACAVRYRSDLDVRNQASTQKSQVAYFRSEISAPAENGRLMLAKTSSPRNTASREETVHYTNVNASTPRFSTTVDEDEPEDDSQRVVRDIPTQKSADRDGWQQRPRSDGIEVAEGAWLFRRVGSESYSVDRLALIGGERITYHVNNAGKVDFVEATVSAASAASERLSNVGRWQERISVDELEQRLAKSRVNVGRVEKVEAVLLSTSGRVSELEVSGDQGRARLRGRQITSALGLKETMFVVSPEKDGRGRVVAFVFNGRGWGHGVGMCQNGALALAKDGQSYTAIIQKYYTGVKVQEVY